MDESSIFLTGGVDSVVVCGLGYKYLSQLGSNLGFINPPKSYLHVSQSWADHGSHGERITVKMTVGLINVELRRPQSL